MTARIPHCQLFSVLPAIILATGLAAAGPQPVGTLVGSENAVLDGRPPLAHTTILSGDRLEVNDGLAMVTLGRENRLVLGTSSEASFLCDGGSVKVSLARGGMSFLHPRTGDKFRILAGDVAIQPAADSRTLGGISLADGTLMITAKKGALDVEQSGNARHVSTGDTMTVTIQAARAPASSAKQRVKYIFNRQKLVIGTLVAGGTATAVAVIALARSSKEVSPTVPSF